MDINQLYEELAPTMSKVYKDLMPSVQEICEAKGWTMVQLNGQRICSPPPSMGFDPPPKGCEVYIGRLSKDVFENELIPMFEAAGPLYQFRMMIDFNDQGRGFAFATYFNYKSAKRAVERFNNYNLRPNVRLCVQHSIDNCRLYVGNLPRTARRSDVYDLLNPLVLGIKDIIMYPNPERQEENKGYCFVEFENHRLAFLARRDFAPNNLRAFGRQLYIDWAEPLPIVDPNVMAEVKVLYLKGLPTYCTGKALKSVIQNILVVDVKVKKLGSYAFVHFNDRRTAEYAYGQLHDFTWHGKPIEVHWSIPPKYGRIRMPKRMTKGKSKQKKLRRQRQEKEEDYENEIEKSGTEKIIDITNNDSVETCISGLENLHMNEE